MAVASSVSRLRLFEASDRCEVCSVSEWEDYCMEVYGCGICRGLVGVDSMGGSWVDAYCEMGDCCSRERDEGPNECFLESFPCSVGSLEDCCCCYCCVGMGVSGTAFEGRLLWKLVENCYCYYCYSPLSEWMEGWYV